MHKSVRLEKAGECMLVYTSTEVAPSSNL